MTIADTPGASQQTKIVESGSVNDPAGAEQRLAAKLAGAAPSSVEAAADAIDSKFAARTEDGRPEVSATTLARMMGVATGADLKLIEGKIDLVSSRMTAVTMRSEKILTMLGNMPTGGDLERIDVQIGALRGMIKDLLATMQGETPKKPTP
jgi:hypothetical protein